MNALLITAAAAAGLFAARSIITAAIARNGLKTNTVTPQSPAQLRSEKPPDDFPKRQFGLGTTSSPVTKSPTPAINPVIRTPPREVNNNRILKMNTPENKTPPPYKPYAAPAAAAPFATDIERAAAKHNVPKEILYELLYQESRYRPDIISGKTKSPVGASGIAQFMDATAKEWNVNPLDPTSAIDGAARYLRWLYKNLDSSWVNALGGYNWGIGNVRRRGITAAPAETRKYIANIINAANPGQQIPLTNSDHEILQNFGGAA